MNVNNRKRIKASEYTGPNYQFQGIDIPSCGPCNDAAEICATFCVYTTSQGVCRAEHSTTSAFLSICSIRSANGGQRYRSAIS